MATDRPRGFVHPKPRGRIAPVQGVPGVSIHTTGDGIVTVQRDLVLPFPEHDPGLQPGEKLAQIVGTLLAVLHQPSPPSRTTTIEGVSVATSKEDEPLPVHRALARSQLQRDKEDVEWYGEAALIEAEELLAAAIAVDLRRFARSARRVLQGAREPAYSWRRIEEDLAAGGSLWLDEDGAAWLDDITGNRGKEFAALLRKGSQERAEAWRNDEPLPGMERDPSKIWRAWLDERAHPTPVPWANFLAEALWFEEIKPEWRIKQERRAEAEERDARGIGSALLIGLRYALSNVSGPVVITDHDRALRVHGAETGLYAAEQLAPGLDLDVFRTMARHLHTVPARRAIYWLSQVAWRVYVEGGRAKGDGWAAARTPGGNTIEIMVTGGKRQLGHLVGATTNNQNKVVFKTIQTLRGIDVHLDTSLVRGPTSLVKDVLEYPSAPGRQARIQIDLSFLWSVGATHELQGASRLLVPVLNVPPMLGLHSNHQGRVAAMEERALVHLAQESRELAKRGGVPIPWKQFADERRVPADIAERVLRAWTDTDRWRRTHAGYRLGESDEEVERAHRLLVDGGERREKSAARGRKTADKKKRR